MNDKTAKDPHPPAGSRQVDDAHKLSLSCSSDGPDDRPDTAPLGP
jgi:hypothetical protein